MNSETINEKENQIPNENKGEKNEVKRVKKTPGRKPKVKKNSVDQEIIDPELDTKLEINAKFSSKEKLTAAVHEFGEKNKFKFHIVENTRTLSFTCIGKKEFHCDAMIHCFFKKKENIFYVKKIRMEHKCPPEMDDTNFIENQIKKMNNLRIGEIISEMNKRNIKIGYSGVHQILYGTSQKENSEENFLNYKSLNVCFSEELKILNPSISTFATENFIFVDFNIFKHVRNVVEMRHIPLKNGHLIFTLCFDGHDNPIVGAFTATNSDKSIEELINDHFQNLSLLPNTVTLVDLKLVQFLNLVNQRENFNFYIKTRSICKLIYEKYASTNLVVKIWDICNGFIDYEEIPELIDIFNENDIIIGSEKNIDLQKNIDSQKNLENSDLDSQNNLENSDLDSLENIDSQKNLESEQIKNSYENLEKNNLESEQIKNSNLENNIKNSDLENNKKNSKFIIKKNNFSKSEKCLYGIENMSDPDLDLIYYNYNGSVFEIANTIFKLVGDSNNLRRKKESGIGDNIKKRVLRLIDCEYTIEEIADSHNIIINNEKWNVSLNEHFCRCGYFQELGYPCTHAIILIKSLGLNPLTFVSSIYKRGDFYTEIVPVLNENVKINVSNNLLLKRGPGRPKKGDLKKYGEIHTL